MRSGALGVGIYRSPHRDCNTVEPFRQAVGRVCHQRRLLRPEATITSDHPEEHSALRPISLGLVFLLALYGAPQAESSNQLAFTRMVTLSDLDSALNKMPRC